MNEYQIEKLKALLRDNISNCYRPVSAGGGTLVTPNTRAYLAKTWICVKMREGNTRN